MDALLREPSMSRDRMQEINKLIQERIAAARSNERQIKYLGLVIEKEDE